MPVHAALQLVHQGLDLSLVGSDRRLRVVGVLGHLWRSNQIQDLRVNIARFISFLCDGLQLILKGGETLRLPKDLCLVLHQFLCMRSHFTAYRLSMRVDLRSNA